jgi:hypothetical protein
VDNVFSQAAFCFLACKMMQLTKTEKGVAVADTEGNELLRWVFIALVTVLQEADPWNINFTIAPIALALLMVRSWASASCYHHAHHSVMLPPQAVVRFIAARRMPHCDSRFLVCGLAWLGCAVYCFSKGLDDHNDYVIAPPWLADVFQSKTGKEIKMNRVFHGGWHICVGALFYFLLRAFELPDHSTLDKQKEL